MATVVERVDRLEEVLKEFVTSVGIEFNKLYNSQLRTEAELRAFKNEMAEFKNEMLDFKDEMAHFKDEVREQNREMNRKWGDMANKLGTIVEDLVAPSLPRIIEEQFHEPVLDLMVRRKRRLTDGRVREFDAVAVTAQLIFLNSTKATLRSLDVDRFVEEIAAFREFFPEYDALPLVGILASLAVDESVLNYVEATGFLVLAVGDQLMDVQNRSGFEPKRWSQNVGSTSRGRVGIALPDESQTLYPRPPILLRRPEGCGCSVIHDRPKRDPTTRSPRPFQ